MPIWDIMHGNLSVENGSTGHANKILSRASFLMWFHLPQKILFLSFLKNFYVFLRFHDPFSNCFDFSVCVSSSGVWYLTLFYTMYCVSLLSAGYFCVCLEPHIPWNWEFLSSGTMSLLSHVTLICIPNPQPCRQAMDVSYVVVDGFDK